MSARFPGFTPNQFTFKGASKSTRIELDGLDPGRTYYVKAVPRAADGSVGRGVPPRLHRFRRAPPGGLDAGEAR